LWNENGQKLSSWTSSYERAAATKLTYKQFTFQPRIEKQQMDRKIQELKLDQLLKQIKDWHSYLMLLNDGRVLASGGGVLVNQQWQPISALAILDPRKQTITKLAGLCVPRLDDAVVQLKDGRVIFIGGETTKNFADDGSDNLTNTVEELDLQSGRSQIIGRIPMARHGLMSEIVGDREILVVGGWNQRTFARDERWWPGGEIFRVPPKTKAPASAK